MDLNNTKICIGSDHAGYTLKKEIYDYLNNHGCDIVDIGCHSLDPVDYTDIALKVSKDVADGTFGCGIIICGTGIGVSMVANKVKGIRAALCYNSYTAVMAREHNDANVVCMGARVIGSGVAKSIIDAFLSTEFEAGGRHQDRVNNIMKIENGEF